MHGGAKRASIKSQDPRGGNKTKKKLRWRFGCIRQEQKSHENKEEGKGEGVVTEGREKGKVFHGTRCGVELSNWCSCLRGTRSAGSGVRLLGTCALKTFW